MSINPPAGQQPQPAPFIESVAPVQNQAAANGPVSITLDTQPGDPDITVKPHDTDKSERKVDKAQVAWHAFKLAGLLTVGLPFAVFGAAFYMLGWTATSIATAKTPWRFKEDMAEGVGNVLSPLLEQIQGIASELNKGELNKGNDEQHEPVTNSEASIAVSPDSGDQDFGGAGPAPGSVGQAEEERVMRQGANPAAAVSGQGQQAPAAGGLPDSEEARDTRESREPNSGDALPVSMPRAQSNQEADRKRQQEQEKLEQDRADQRRAEQQRADIAHDQKTQDAQRAPPAQDE